MGSFRKFCIDKLFKETIQDLGDEGIKNVTKILAPGSTNVTSDYDITITGPIPSTIIEKMFKKFKEMYGTSLPIAFDTNLYPASASYNKLNSYNKDNQEYFRKNKDAFQIITIQNEDYVLVIPKDKSVILNCYYWATVKLASLDNEDIKNLFGDNKDDDDKNIYMHAEKINNYCNDILCKNTNKIDYKDTDDVKTREEKRIEHNYTLQCKFGKILEEYMNSEDLINQSAPWKKDTFINENNLGNLRRYINSILGFSSLILWLCSEAYYADYTVYAIVISMQLGEDSNDLFGPHIWLCSVIENLGDFRKHIGHELGEIQNEGNLEDLYKVIIIKYSKYVYRIYYCLSQYYYSIAKGEQDEQRRKKNFEEGDYIHVKAESYKKFVERRRDYNLEKANNDNIWKIIHEDIKNNSNKNSNEDRSEDSDPESNLESEFDLESEPEPNKIDIDVINNWIEFTTSTIINMIKTDEFFNNFLKE